MKADRLNNADIVNKYLSPGSFIMIPLRTDLPGTTGLGKQVLRVIRNFNISMSDLILVHINDENKPTEVLAQFYSGFRKVYRLQKTYSNCLRTFRSIIILLSIEL